MRIGFTQAPPDQVCLRRSGGLESLDAQHPGARHQVRGNAVRYAKEVAYLHAQGSGRSLHGIRGQPPMCTIYHGISKQLLGERAHVLEP